ncbi:uncharacterized protein LOC107399368 [Peromyscus maniculatus bairdii]|uniref:uncharacterized protein LOC107399368 n=1 Tax=Peromyscus maniculatus bairdii TaxID=230844 RepID=UPI001C2E4ED3|nr:integrator complex subunit 6-like [Peromyscus maniculatus bairdii]XP_042125316.1 integrator complex subunit 6-like [Peromyscus maniculatus bairdii]
MMAEKSKELSVRSEKEEDPAGDAVDPTLPQMGSIVTMMPVGEEEGEVHLKASVTANGEGEAVIREVPPRVAAAADCGRVPSGYPGSREKLNAEIKRQLMKEIRRYGRNYGRIFKLLEEVQGPLEVQIQFIEFTIKEAARFKRRHLIQFLEKKREEILSQSFLSNNDPPADM